MQPAAKRNLSASFSHCTHSFSAANDSVLEICQLPNNRIAGGTENGRLIVWDLSTFAEVVTLECHDSHILSMLYYNQVLYTAGGDGKIMGWSITDFQCRVVIHAAFDSGEILALAIHQEVLYLGCKNGSLQWFELGRQYAKQKMFEHWDSQDNRFFDTEKSFHDLQKQNPKADLFVIMQGMYIGLAHHGAINSLLVHEQKLYSCSGDGVVKIWELDQVKPRVSQSISVSRGSVFRLHIQDGYLYAGLQRGEIKCFDLESQQCIRTLVGHTDDVLALAGQNSILVSGSADGSIKTWNRNFECVMTIQAHEGFVLCISVSNSSLVTGGNGLLKVWDVPQLYRQLDEEHAPFLFQDQMMIALEKFVSFQSISGRDDCLQECLDAANFLKSLCKELGAQTRLVQGKNNKNSIVLAKFISGKNNQSVLYYGHYDTQPVVRSKWHTDPFRLTGKDGYVYARGVSDNKGPTLAAIYAVSEMQKNKTLKHDVYFIVEGEEESGSSGLYESIQEQGDFFPPTIDVVLISNSYWYDEVTPCLTYGLRGVVHADIIITGHSQTDVHSGVHGGSLDEPMDDLVKVLAQVFDKSTRAVAIEGFTDDVAPVTEFERLSYERLARYELGNDVDDAAIRAKVQSLQSKWRTPSFTIHNIKVSGNLTNTVIPHSVTANVSFRIVPNQKLDEIINMFESFARLKFDQLKSLNKMDIIVGHRANWWLGNYESKVYQAAEKAIVKEWQTAPLYIREGGSLPAVPWLQQHFKSSVVHIPMGQASDSAHLPNERIRIRNLLAGRRVIQNFLTEL